MQLQKTLQDCSSLKLIFYFYFSIFNSLNLHVGNFRDVCCIDQRHLAESIHYCHTVVRIISQFKAQTLSDRVGSPGQKQWRRSQIKSVCVWGGVNIEKSEGVGSGEGLCPP